MPNILSGINNNITPIASLLSHFFLPWIIQTTKIGIIIDNDIKIVSVKYSGLKIKNLS